MSQQIVNIGDKPGDGSGDPLRVSFNKINENFSELYGNISTITGNSAAFAVYTKSEIDSMYATLYAIATGVDFGFIGNGAVDYGSITDPVTIILDYGSV